ncbi:MAG TPA: redoxin domain-containing protein [Candidatus Eisenbacteria bacterium]|nr:redoxin domain-containing protein [Candidatus Eisenbacteria bacterium]
MKRPLALTLVAALMASGSLLAADGKKGGKKTAAADNGLPPDAHELKIGDAAPGFSLKSVDGKTYTLASFKDAKVLMVIFLSNHCPYSHAIETRLLPFVAEAKKRGLAVVAINPNHPDAVRVDELGYSKYNDSYDEMKLYAKEQGFTFPYLYDGETQATAKAYGCLATPHVFLFDRERRLRYMGRYDDSRFADPATVTSRDTPNAVDAMLAGKPVPIEVTKPMGCSTKWLLKMGEVAQATEAWEKTPVAVESIDAAGVAALAKNGTQKLRVINVWATWCAPCVHEFPGLVSLARRLSNRDFELITISMDDPSDEAKVKQFLEKQHVALPNKTKRSVQSEGRRTNNYLFTGANTDALVKALDPEWPGPLPHTVVIAPGGKIVYRHTGEFDPVELQTKVIEQLGPYYTP